MKIWCVKFRKNSEPLYVAADNLADVVKRHPHADAIAFFADAEVLTPEKPAEPVTVTVTTSPVPDGDTYTGTSQAFQDRLDDVRLPKEG